MDHAVDSNKNITITTKTWRDLQGASGSNRSFEVRVGGRWIRYCLYSYSPQVVVLCKIIGQDAAPPEDEWLPNEIRLNMNDLANGVLREVVTPLAAATRERDRAREERDLANLELAKVQEKLRVAELERDAARRERDAAAESARIRLDLQHQAEHALNTTQRERDAARKELDSTLGVYWLERIRDAINGTTGLRWALTPESVVTHAAELRRMYDGASERADRFQRERDQLRRAVDGVQQAMTHVPAVKP